MQLGLVFSVLIFVGNLNDSSQLKNFSRLSTARFDPKIFTLKLQCRRKKHSKINSFWAPRFTTRELPKFGRRFPNLAHLRTCVKVSLSSVRDLIRGWRSKNEDGLYIAIKRKCIYDGHKALNSK